MKTGAADAKATVFGVDLGDASFEAAAATDVVTVKVGDLELTAEAGKTGKITASDIATAIITKYGADGASKADVVFRDADGTDQTFTVAAGASGSELLFGCAHQGGRGRGSGSDC